MIRRPNFLTILWALIILILCGTPGKDVPHFSFLDLLAIDKFVHVGFFFVLVILAIRGFRLQSSQKWRCKNSTFLAVSLSILYGGILEILQETVFVDRSADINDFIANSFGCFVALLLYPKIASRFSGLKFKMPL